MNKGSVYCILLFFSSQLWFQQSSAQETGRRWMVGGRVGANLWLTDYKDGVGGDSWELMLRYGVARWFSFGLQLGYEELKASNKPNIPGLSADYMKLHSFPASFVGTIHILPGRRIDPFLYFGVGGIVYQRKDGLGNFVGGTGLKASYHIPVGVGVETFVFDDVSFVVDGGYRLLDDKTDFLQNGGNDSYLTARAGLNWYFGKKRYCKEIDDDSDDPDKDGLTMDQEAERKTDPCNSDTDGDGLNDGDESLKHTTDPNKRDTDGDGLFDGEEVRNYQTNPTVADTDGDGLNDGEEVQQHKTNPLIADTDNDRLSDGDEIKKYGSNPLVADTDADALSDGDEVLVHRTNPLNADSDGDGCADGDEVLNFRTDPLKKDCSPAVVPSPDTTELDLTQKFMVANFGVAKTLLPDTVSLAKALALLMKHTDIAVTITGHADSTGTDAINFRLSQQRADVVKAWLTRRGVRAARMTTDGRGSREPVAPNSTVEGRAMNRRVEIQKR